MHTVTCESNTRHQVEEALRSSERDFRAFFEMAGGGNVIADARTGLFMRVNQHFCELTGYSEEELRGMTAHTLTHPDDVDRDRAPAGSLTTESRYRRKDGKAIWVQVTSMLVRDDHGEPLHTIGVVRDVTDQHQATEKLENARVELQRAVQESTERERQRMGDAMHHDLCQNLLGAAFLARALANSLAPLSPAAASAEKLALLINSMVQQTRDVVRGLNSPDTVVPPAESVS